MFRVVLVHWVDSTRNHEWQNYKRAIDSGSLICKSLGFLIDELPDRILVAGHIDPSNECCEAAITIPRQAIVKMWEIDLEGGY